MLYAALAAVAVVDVVGRDLAPALEALERLPPSGHRLQPRRLDSGAILLRDEAKSPLETVEAALEVMAEIRGGRKIVVLGDVTEPRAIEVYRELGARFAGFAALAVFVGEKGRRYSVGARRAGMAPEALLDAGKSFRRAAELLPDDLGPGDVILIKGRETQHLERISLLLEGRRVACELVYCNLPGMACGRCPMLERGWEGRHVPM